MAVATLAARANPLPAQQAAPASARTLARVAARATPGDQVWIVLIGHGSAQGEVSRFNLPGPDLTASDFARMLEPLARQRVAFVNASSASGDFVKALAGPGRAIVTATRSPTERNATQFARHFATALATPGADVDKDGGVSLLEAFAFAKREVARAATRASVRATSSRVERALMRPGARAGSSARYATSSAATPKRVRAASTTASAASWNDAA